jgi:hypothetical protein
MKTVWKVFFIFTVIFATVGLFVVAFNMLRGTNLFIEPLFVMLRFVLLIPLFGFVYGKRILNPSLWRVLVVVQIAAILTDFVVDLFSSAEFSVEEIFQLKIRIDLFFVSVLPVWYAVFRYSSSSHPIWATNTVVSKEIQKIEA